ncbi:MAG: tryptophan synthase subunit alpha, partial [Actinomycetia bacterium]|nr:tryptophan synthase subunit alpha [Actinomycetes bacterium]
MSRIKDAFIDAEGGRKKAFIAYLMAGDPSLEASARYILAVQEAGADLIEVGIPFSDPIAEGEVIQAASVRAIAAGTRLTGVFQMLASIQGKMHIPVVLMTYLNPVFVYGYQRFCTQAAELGIAGLILPDLPFEEQGELRGVANQQGIEVVTMLAPTSASRAACLAEQAQGFVYLVSSLGVTGMRS